MENTHHPRTALEELEALRKEIARLKPSERLASDVAHYARVAKEFEAITAEGDKEWDYLYRAPHEMWNRRKSMIGRFAVRAYWLPREPRVIEPVQPAHMYTFAFKEITDVVISPYNNAYMLVFANGSNEDLTSYDTVCLRIPRV